MKAIVMEIEERYAVVLDKKGCFTKIPNNGTLQVGYEIELAEASRISAGFVTRIASMAAAVLLMVGVGYGAYSYSQPYSYVDIDINPSIELTVNRFDRILKAEAMNEDGAELLKQGRFSHASFKAGVDQILKSAEAAGYFEEEDKNAVMFTVSSKDSGKVERLETNIREVVSEEAVLEEHKTDILVERVTVSQHDDARKQGISPGKLSLIGRLAEVQPEIKAEDYKNKPVKEIMKGIIAGKKAEIAGKKEETPGGEKQEKSEDKEEGTVAEKKENSGKDATPAVDRSNAASDRKEAKEKEKEKAGSGKKASSGQKVKSVEEFIRNKTEVEVDTTTEKDPVKGKEAKEKNKGKKESEASSEKQEDPAEGNGKNGKNGKGNSQKYKK